MARPTFRHWFLASLFACGCATAQPIPDNKPGAGPQPQPAVEQEEEEPGTPIPLDPAVKTGTLENGLTYFIRKHEQPRDRAMLWLAVDAGSVQEDDDQKGLAHFVEHMAFNGTERFPKNTRSSTSSSARGWTSGPT